MMALLTLSRHFPGVGLRCGCERALRTLGAEPARYMGMAIAASAAASAAALLLSGLGLVWAGCAFALCMAFFLALPGMELKAKAAEMEASMPFFLRTLGMLLEMGIPFQRAVGIASDGHGALQDEMRIVLRNVSEGMGLQRALSAFAVSFNSLSMKRALSQVISAYETGASGAEMRRIGDELLSLERHRLREYAARGAVFGLMFIVCGAVLPAFFLVYVIAGRAGIGTPVGEGEAALAMLVVFPSLSVLVLLLSKATRPRSAFPGGKIEAGMLAPGALLAAGLLVPALQLPGLLLGGALGAWLAHSSYRAERRVEEIEAALPDALLSVSGMPKSSGAERTLSLIEGGGFGPLSEEAAKSRRQVGMNVDAGQALDDLAARGRSPMLVRACLMLRHMMETASLDRMNSLAEDMIRAAQLKRERSQLFAMQKYTLVLGAVIVPLILGMALRLLDGMQGLLGGEATVPAVVPAYLVLYSAISSFAIADAEGRGSSVAIYSVGLAALSLATFHFINP